MEDRKCNTAIDSHWTKQCCCFSSGSAVGFDSSTFQHGLGWFPIGFTDANCFLRRLKVTATLCPQRRGEPPPILPGSTHKINTPNLKAKKNYFPQFPIETTNLSFFFFFFFSDAMVTTTTTFFFCMELVAFWRNTIAQLSICDIKKKMRCANLNWIFVPS